MLVAAMNNMVNLLGGLDDVEWSGQELAFFITDELGEERCFMEARLRDPNVTINLLKPGGRSRKPIFVVREVALAELSRWPPGAGGENGPTNSSSICRSQC